MCGSKVIKIKGVKSLKEVSYNIMPDRIEAGTLLIATAMSGGKINLKKMNPEHISPIIYKLEETGAKLNVEKNSIVLAAPKRPKAVEFKTLPYPGFPTDLQSIFACMLTIARGTSIITENIFENRFKTFAELKRMGAKANIEGKTLVIKGVRKLHGAEVQSTDLRGGAALVLAGLVAKGSTKVKNIEYILRGYENLDEKLNSLGAKITRGGD